MIEKRQPVMLAGTVIETLEQSEADLAAGRWESFDELLARVDRRIAAWPGVPAGEQAELPVDA